MGRGWLLAIGAIVLVLIAGGAAYVRTRPSAIDYDRDFDASVASPAYARRGPTVLFDEGHRNAQLTTTGYRPLAQLLRADGYAVRVSRGEITTETLAPAAVLVIAGAQGANESGDAPAFSEAEAAAISEWVLRGGSLLLVTDHWPVSAAAVSLAERFGVEMGQGLTEDPTFADPALGPANVAFTRESGALGGHAITRGRSADESLTRVLTFTGQSLVGPADAVAFMQLSPQARDLPLSAPGGALSEPASAAGRAQAVAVNFGRGRVVVLGEAAMLRAYVDERGELIGMNRPGYDNRQLALNIMHWLSRLI